MAQSQNAVFEKITRKSNRVEREGDKPNYHAGKRDRTVQRSKERRAKTSARYE